MAWGAVEDEGAVGARGGWWMGMGGGRRKNERRGEKGEMDG